MAIASYEVHDRDSLGLPCRQATITCRRGETTRVVVRTWDVPLTHHQELIRMAVEKHDATSHCGCAPTIMQGRSARHRRDR